MAKRKTMSVLTMSGVQYDVKDRDGRKASYVKSELEGRATKTVGSIAAGTDLTGKTVGEVLADILMGYVAPSALSIGTNLGTGVKEKGVQVTINKVTPTFTAGSKAITEFVVKEGDSSGNELYSGETVTSGTAVTLTTPVSGDGSSALKVWAQIKDEAGTTKSGSAQITFVDPIFVGVTGATAPQSSDVKALTKKVEAKGSKTCPLSGSGRACFAYPASYGSLVTIQDGNGFDVTDDFVKTTVTVTVASGDVSYFVYTAKNEAGYSNDNYKFNF